MSQEHVFESAPAPKGITFLDWEHGDREKIINRAKILAGILPPVMRDKIVKSLDKDLENVLKPQS